MSMRGAYGGEVGVFLALSDLYRYNIMGYRGIFHNWKLISVKHLPRNNNL